MYVNMTNDSFGTPATLSFFSDEPYYPRRAPLKASLPALTMKSLPQSSSPLGSSLQKSTCGRTLVLNDGHGPSAFHNGIADNERVLSKPQRRPTLEELPSVGPQFPLSSPPRIMHVDGGKTPRRPRRTQTLEKIELE